MNTSAELQSSRSAQERVVELAHRMLIGELSFFEGAAQVVGLKGQLEGVPEKDRDFDVFLLIYSETDHLPLAAQRRFLSEAALTQIEQELVATEEWARPFAEPACKRLIARFGV